MNGILRINRPEFWYLLFAVLLLPALLINLGSHHVFVHTDESRRALVALEMILNKQWVAPTLNGEFYFNKPPAYNWIIALSFKLFGNYSAFALRFPVVVSLVLFGWVIYRTMKPVMGREFAWLVLIATLTCGRILFYDSFLGLIDICFSVLVFANFMLYYSPGSKGPSIPLFAASYSLMAIAYLMKGLPPVVFQALTILAWVVYHRRVSYLWHRWHLIGALFFILPVGLYYYLYLQVNPQSLEVLFTTIFSESSKRTVTEYGFADTLLNLLLFPVENLYHFAPWTILAVALFRKGILKALWQHPFIRFCMLVFGFNIAVYWTSPGVHPRYLFMFLPLFFAILFFAYREVNTGVKFWVEKIILFVMMAACITPIIWWNFAPERGDVSWYAIALMVLALAAVCVGYYRLKPLRWIVLGCFLLVLRIGFDITLLPHRDARGKTFEAAMEQTIALVGDEDLYILSPNYCHDGNSFMLSRHREKILKVKYQAEPGAYYIVYDGAYDPTRYETFLEFQTRGTDRTLYLVRLRDQNEEGQPSH